MTTTMELVLAVHNIYLKRNKLWNVEFDNPNLHHVYDKHEASIVVLILLYQNPVWENRIAWRNKYNNEHAKVINLEWKIILCLQNLHLVCKLFLSGLNKCKCNVHTVYL
jgi:hypothetical protein